jgi:glycosyltransferase involved in cell wall biosynthesis/ubiquinone/menaquinone biosynthesis C-methylase UbiE
VGQSGFDRIARTFARDVDDAIASGRYARGNAFGALAARWVPRGARVLDFGCGPGRLSMLLARAGYRVHGVDPSEGMIEQAHALIQDGLAMEFEQGADAAALETGAYDAVVCSSVIEYVAKPRGLLDELHRALRPSGILIVSFANRASFWRWYWRTCGAQNPLGAEQNHAWRWPEFRSLLRESNFRSLSRVRYFESPLDGSSLDRWLDAIPLGGSLGIVAAQRVDDPPARATSAAGEVPTHASVASRARPSLLLIFDQPPWPLRGNGFTIRYHPILEALSTRFDVDLLLLPGLRDAEIDVGDPLRPMLRSVRRLDAARLSPARRWLRRIEFFAVYLSPGSDPAICHAYEQPELETALRSILAHDGYDAVVLASAKHAALVRRLRELVTCGSLVVDLIDSLALLVDRSSFGKTGAVLRRLEVPRLRRLEREVARLADHVIYVSRVDADYANAGAANVSVIPNGVSTAGLAGEAERRPARWSVGFFGSMSYWPNVRASIWLAERVMSRLRRTHPDASLAIIGRDPTAAVRRLGEREGVTVTGWVENIWEYVCALQVCAFPMLEGAGLQNKVLEAMCAGRPVVTTSIGNEGIDAAPGREILIADDEEGFAGAISRLLRDPDAACGIGEAGRAFARARFSWHGALERFEAVLHG